MTPFVIAVGNEDHHVTVLLTALAVMLGAARLLGEIARRYGQPSIIGELLAGILLGPTVLGYLWPEGYAFLFADDQATKLVLDGIVMLSATLLLLVAGMEVDLSIALRQGKAAMKVGVVGMVIPLAMGGAIGWFWPAAFAAPPMPDANWRIAFAVFAGIALAITALPVIARILMDLDIFQADLGMLIMSAAILNDLIGWLGFALVMALIAPAGEDASFAATMGATLAMTVGFTVLVLTVGRALFHRVLPFVQVYGTWPGAVLALLIVVTLLCAAVTEWIGIHAIFGAFLAGVAFGDSHHLRERTRETVNQFVTSIFAPLFFASIGIGVNFLTAVRPLPIVLALVVAVGAKVAGSYLGARGAGLGRREGLAAAIGMTAQGTMGIILGQLALQQQLISEAFFVAIVIVALVTSIGAGAALQRVLRIKSPRKLTDLLSEKQWISWLKSTTVQGAIAELCHAAGAVLKREPATLIEPVWAREQMLSTGIGQEVAIPHARLPDLKDSLLIVGRSRDGVDFDAPDGKQAQIICLLLTPLADPTAQLDLLRIIAETFENPACRQSALAADTYTQFLAAIKLPVDESKRRSVLVPQSTTGI